MPPDSAWQWPFDGVSDAHTFVEIERSSKLILAWHLGKRTSGPENHVWTVRELSTESVKY